MKSALDALAMLDIYLLPRQWPENFVCVPLWTYDSEQIDSDRFRTKMKKISKAGKSVHWFQPFPIRKLTPNMRQFFVSRWFLEKEEI
jgi:hypothetical protein